MRFFSLFLVFVALPAFADLVQEAQRQAVELKLHETRQWRKLLHYERGFWGGLESQVDAANFFLSENGKEDLKAELEAAIAAFMTPDTMNLEEQFRPQCRFPARFMFLKKSLPQVQWPEVSCLNFIKYHGALRGVSVSLVFSSYYLNNPSSAFGHTFLRINKAPASDGKRYELLDYGINYAATVDTNNALIYGFKGMFGLFPGNFTSVPYYYKVREYNNAESRDLWEYELNVTPDEVDMLIAHLWELGPTYIDYWYLTENCSYHMLTILEAAAPRLDLTSRLKKWVIPSDTIRVAWNTPDLVNSVFYRPSIRSEFFARVEKLNEKEKDMVKELVYDRVFTEELKQAPDTVRQGVLDAAMDYMDYEFAHEVQQPGPETDFKNKILSERSQLKLVSEKLVVSPSPREIPHLSHGSRRLGLGYLGSENGGDYYDLEVKFALHDQLELITGYPEYAEITFGDLNLGFYPDTDKVEIENFILFEVISHSPVMEFANDFSWQVKFGMERIKDENCYGCESGILNGGFGYTLRFSREPLTTLFAGVKAQVYYVLAGETSSRFVPGLGPAARMRLRVSDRWIFLADAWYRKDFDVQEKIYQEYSLATQVSLDKSWGLRLTGKDQIFDKSLKFDVLYYY